MKLRGLIISKSGCDLEVVAVMRFIFVSFLFSPSASKAKVREAHRRIMLLNHPDRGQLMSSVFIGSVHGLLRGLCSIHSLD